MKAESPSLLTGLIFDGGGNRLIPTHAIKTGRRYRYYVSKVLVTEGRGSAPEAYRVPAAEIEALVAGQIRTFLSDRAAVFEMVRRAIADGAIQGRLVEAACALAEAWPDLPPPRRRLLLRTLVSRIEVHPDRVAVRLSPARLRSVLTAPPGTTSAADVPVDETAMTLTVSAQMKRVGMSVRMLIDGTGRADISATPDRSLVRLLAKARALQEKLLRSAGATIASIASDEKMSGSYFARLLRLNYLAPDITADILQGRQPPALSAKVLMTGWDLPFAWSQQRKVLGFT